MAKKPKCSELAKTLTDIAMNLSSRPGVNNLDDVVKRMKKDLPGISRQNVVDAIVEATTRGPKSKVSEVVRTINAIKAEARQDKRLQAKISELETILEEGQVPQPAQKAKRQASQAIAGLKAIQADLKAKIRTSEPAKKARLQKQIDSLNIRLEEGDFGPKAKPEPTRQSKELEHLEFERDQVKQQIQREIQKLKPKTIWEHIAEPFNTARAIITSFELSAVLRQGGILFFSRPTLTGRALPAMFKALTSPQQMAKINKEIQERPNAPLYAKSKLFIAPTDGTHKLSKLEEAYQTNWAAKIPGVAASERAYLTFLNKIRADAFDTFTATLTRDGEVTPKEAKAIANYINIVTGRGTLGSLERAAVPLNVLFFSPRLAASRFQFLVGQPLFGGNARTRKLIAKQYARFAIGLGLMYGLTLFAFGGDDEGDVTVEKDPRSSDFGKIRIGKTRLDPLSGLSQTTVLMSRLISGETKSTVTGEITPIRGKDVPFGKSKTQDVVARFLRNKLSPMFGTGANIVAGENFIGEPVTVKSTVRGLLVPIFAQDIVETVKQQNLPVSTATILVALFGMGVATYGSEYKPKSQPAFKPRKTTTRPAFRSRRTTDARRTR